MLNEELMDRIYMVAEKMSKGENLTLEEQDMYDEILEDVEAYRAFCLFTTMLDMPEILASGIREKSEVYNDRDDIEKHLSPKDKNEDKFFSK